jgi:DNA modification methylase
MPESVTDRCTKAHEYIFLLSKNKKYYYDHEAIKEPQTSASLKRQKRGVSKNNKWIDGANGQTPHNTHQPRDNDKNRDVNLYKNKRSVWTVNTAKYREAHFAVYPKELIEPCILAGCPEDGTVLDPFSGSGTTGIVAVNSGRKYIGLELNPEYAELSLNRIQDECPNTLTEFMV